MEKDNYKRQLQMFRKRAAFYQQCEARMHAMEKASTVREAMSLYGVNEYTMLKDNNNYVQCVLGWIKENYGSDAADIIAKNYVQGFPQKEISHDYHLSLRTMQRHMHKWLKEGLNQNDQ